MISALGAGWPLPLVTIWWAQLLIMVLALTLMLTLSGHIVAYFVGTPLQVEQTSRRFDAGAIIGKSENILVFVFVLSGQFGGLALILAAKTIARMESIRKDASYYLGGTLVNLVWSILVSVLTHLLVFGPVGNPPN